jgi:hypothetical protein
VLVAGKNSLDSKDDGTAMQCRIAEERGEVALGIRQRMVVADQHDSGFGDFVADLARRKNPLIGAVGIVEVANVFAAARRIGGANFALHACYGVALGYAAPRS